MEALMNWLRRYWFDALVLVAAAASAAMMAWFAVRDIA